MHFKLIVAFVEDKKTDAVMQAAREAGASAILLAAPPYAVPTDKELALHALAVDKACGLPIMLYNNPFTSNVDMKSGSPAFGTPEHFRASLAAAWWTILASASCEMRYRLRRA